MKQHAHILDQTPAGILVALAAIVSMATVALRYRRRGPDRSPCSRCPERDLIRDHCVMAHLSESQGREDEALAHYEEELRLVNEVRANASIEGDRALRIFHGEVDHIFEDFALFLARGSGSRSADLNRALQVSEI